MRKNARMIMMIIALNLMISPVLAQTDHIGTVSNLQPHPRILLFKGDEAAIAKTVSADTTWQKLQQAMFAECDSLLTKPPVERIQIGRRLLDKSREALRR